MDHPALPRPGSLCLTLALLTAIGCAGAPRPCPPVIWPPPAAPPPAAPATAPAPAAEPTYRPQLAVLPIHEGKLFRAERAALRQQLASVLAAHNPDYDLVPLAQVDAKLRQVSPTTGVRCAYDGLSDESQIKHRGWQHTELVHVVGHRGEPEKLWVQILQGDHLVRVLEGPFDYLPQTQIRYERAFASLVRRDDGRGVGGLLGVLGTATPTGKVVSGSITLCEEELPFSRCLPVTHKWSDAAERLSACYEEPGLDEAGDELLIDGAAQRCELTYVDDLESHRGRREGCLCAALQSSPGMTAAAGRRRLQVDFLAAELADRPRPELRVVEVSTNLAGARTEWRNVPSAGPDAQTAPRPSRYRLVVDNLDRLAPALGRCDAPAASLFIADLDLDESGAVQAGRLISGTADRKLQACLTQALGRGRFRCSDDGKPARLRLLLQWPDGSG